MTLSPEQKQALTSWVAAGDNLSTIQQKLTAQFQVSLTYMDVRFLVDDLNLALKDPKPAASASDVTKATPAPSHPGEKPAEKKGFFDKVKEKVGLGGKDDADEGDALPEEKMMEDEPFPEEVPTPGTSNVKVTVDNVTLIPGALASGTVTFSDGVTGKWIVDQYGRPGFTEISQPGYRPNATDAQAFVQELTRTIQQRGY